MKTKDIGCECYRKLKFCPICGKQIRKDKEEKDIKKATIYCFTATLEYLDEYEWVEAPDIDDYVSVTPDQLYLNRELIHKDILAMLEKGGAIDGLC